MPVTSFSFIPGNTWSPLASYDLGPTYTFTYNMQGGGSGVGGGSGISYPNALDYIPRNELYHPLGLAPCSGTTTTQLVVESWDTDINNFAGSTGPVVTVVTGGDFVSFDIAQLTTNPDNSGFPRMSDMVLFGTFTIGRTGPLDELTETTDCITVKSHAIQAEPYYVYEVFPHTDTYYGGPYYRPFVTTGVFLYYQYHTFFRTVIVEDPFLNANVIYDRDFYFTGTDIAPGYYFYSKSSVGTDGTTFPFASITPWGPVRLVGPGSLTDHPVSFVSSSLSLVELLPATPITGTTIGYFDPIGEYIGTTGWYGITEDTLVAQSTTTFDTTFEGFSAYETIVTYTTTTGSPVSTSLDSQYTNVTHSFQDTGTTVESSTIAESGLATFTGYTVTRGTTVSDVITHPSEPLASSDTTVTSYHYGYRYAPDQGQRRGVTPFTGAVDGKIDIPVMIPNGFNNIPYPDSFILGKGSSIVNASDGASIHTFTFGNGFSIQLNVPDKANVVFGHSPWVYEPTYRTSSTDSLGNAIFGEKTWTGNFYLV